MYPRPLLDASISAAQSVIHAVPREILSPVKISGSAVGIAYSKQHFPAGSTESLRHPQMYRFRLLNSRIGIDYTGNKCRNEDDRCFRAKADSEPEDHQRDPRDRRNRTDQVKQRVTNMSTRRNHAMAIPSGIPTIAPSR